MKPAAKRSVVVLAICAFCTAAFFILWLRGFEPLRELEAAASDWQTRLGRKTPWDDQLVLIGIDKTAYDPADISQEEKRKEPALVLLEKNYPWSRVVWARLIEKLGDAGAKVIVFDMVFAAISDPEGDAALKQALEKYGDRVVIGYNLNWTETDQRGFLELQLPSETVFTPHAAKSIVEDPRLGYVNLWPEPDGTIRKASFRKTGDDAGQVVASDVILESLDARALRKFGRADAIPPGFEPRRFRWTAPPNTFKPARIGDVLSPKIWAANFHNGADFKDKLVFIGPTTELLHDKHDTPFADPKDMPGPEIHLNVINAAVHGEFLGEPPMPAQLCIITLAGVIAAAVGSFFRQSLRRFLALIVLTAGYALLSHIVFSRAGGAAQVLLVATPILVLLISGITALSYDYFLERREKARVRKTLERYVSRDVVKELLDNPQTYFNARGGVRRNATILFSDVRGFTTLTESADSAALVKQLNEYFEEMVGLVFAHSGSLDKFIGDAVMAVWGNIVSHGPPKDAANAVATALAMKQSLRKLNEDWKTRGMLELAFGIGINHGEVIVGELGSSQKVEFTAIGDPVNLASRLEGLTKEYHLDLLLGENVAALVRDVYLLRTVDYVQVKGKTKPVDVFTVTGEGAAETIMVPAWLARYEEGVRLYRQRSFAEAAKAFQESLRQQPDDYLSGMYLKRCEALIASPPPESWDGVFVMTKK